MCNIRKYVLKHYNIMFKSPSKRYIMIIYRFEGNKSNYSFFGEKIIFHTSHLQKSIEKAFTMQFD